MESPENMPPPAGGNGSPPLPEVPNPRATDPVRQKQPEGLAGDADTVAELRYMNERFQYAVMATQDVVWDWNLLDNTVWWSDTFQTTFGYTAEEVKETIDLWYGLIHPDDHDRVVSSIHQVIGSGQTHWNTEYRFRKGDGTYAIVQDRGNVRHDAGNRPVRMVGSIRDITKAKQDEARLVQQTERLRLAIESTELGTWDFDPQTGVLQWDARCKELFGLSPEAHIDWNVFLKGLHPDDRDRVDAINQRAMAVGSDGYYDCEYRTIGIEDNKLRCIRAKGRSYFDINGRAQRYIGTVLDITEQKTYEQELERRVEDRTDKLAAANTLLQQSNRELEQFAYAASHDLQEPLRKVTVYLGLLKAIVGVPADAKADAYFQKIEKATMRMSSLIKNLLEYSRLDKDQAAFEDVDLNKILADVTVDFEMALAQRSITLTADNLPVVHGVAHQLNQLFYNLIGNAIKFSKAAPDSYIHIVYEDTADDGDSEPSAAGRYHRISVVDNGIGFDQKYATKMFEIFQRLTTPKSTGGHGIGLAICQKIVNHHGGKIWAAGREGAGATFFVQLPAR